MDHSDNFFENPFALSLYGETERFRGSNEEDIFEIFEKTQSVPPLEDIPLQIFNQEYNADLEEIKKIIKQDISMLMPFMIKACQEGNIDAVKYLVNNRFDVIDCVDECERSPMLVAAQNGHLNIINLLWLKDKELFLNRLSLENESPLLAALKNKHNQVAIALLQMGANPLLTDQEGYTPLMYAVKNNMTDVVKFIMKEYPYALKVVAKKGQDALSIAKTVEDAKVTALLTEGIDTTRQDVLNLVLKVAIEKQLFSLKEPLIKLGAVQYLDDYQYILDGELDSELQKSFESYEERQLFLDMALGMAIEKDIPSLVKEFIELGANPNCVYPDGMTTPLSLCATNKDLNCFEELLNYGAKIDGWVLHAAIYSDQNLPMIGRLIEINPVLFNVLDNNSRTNPLLVALLYNKPNVLNYLFTQIDPSVVHEMVASCLPLHRAALAGRFESAEALLEHIDFIKVNQRSLSGVKRLNSDTPLLLLARCKMDNNDPDREQNLVKMADLLISKGADVYAVKKDEGKNAFKIAHQSGKKILACKISESMGVFSNRKFSLIQLTIISNPVSSSRNRENVLPIDYIPRVKIKGN